MNELINLGNGAMVKITMLKGEAGSSISSIAKTSTEGLVDTYTITLTDGSTKTFTVTNGKSIVSIAKTDITGLVDTYTITFNNNSTTTFTVTNGKGISSIAKTTTVGLVDTYTITYNDGTTSTYNVANGKGITSIAKTDTTGLVDTYTITYNDNTTSTFTVTNGANGQDVASSNLATVETTSSASKSYAIGEHLVWNGVYYKVTQAIASGEGFQVGVNIDADTINQQIINATMALFAVPKDTEIILGTNENNKVIYAQKKSFTLQLSENWGAGSTTLLNTAVEEILCYQTIFREYNFNSESYLSARYTGYYMNRDCTIYGGYVNIDSSNKVTISFANHKNAKFKVQGTAVIVYTKV